ncbi:hypothetical protein A2U01_0069359, partial [Trifolium medium]|nr:hypothetical protein [Trifolium medium]
MLRRRKASRQLAQSQDRQRRSSRHGGGRVQARAARLPVEEEDGFVAAVKPLPS